MRTTLSDLKTRGLRRADLPADTTTRAEAIVTDAELTDEANAGLSELHGLILQQRQNHFEATEVVRTTAGVDWTPQPDYCLSVRRVYVHDSGARARLYPWELEDLDGSNTTDTSNRFRWRIQGSLFRWLPAPAAAYDVEVVFLRSFRKLVNPSDPVEPELPEGWEIYPVAHLAEYIQQKRNLDPTPHTAKKAQIAAQIAKLSQVQKETGGSFFKDVSGRFDESRRPRLPWPRS